MSNTKWTISDSVEMDKRKLLAEDFYNKLLDPEEYPMYCSDKASFYAIYFGDPKEAKEIIYKEYGIHVTDQELSMPFWKLLDMLHSEK